MDVIMAAVSYSEERSLLAEKDLKTQRAQRTAAEDAAKKLSDILLLLDRFFSVVVHDSSNSVFQSHTMKVDQQSHLQIQQPQM